MKKEGAYQPAFEAIVWTITSTPTSTDQDFAISGKVTVADASTPFTTLSVYIPTLLVSDYSCTFTGICIGYNGGAAQPAATAVECDYTCKIPQGQAGNTYTVEATTDLTGVPPGTANVQISQQFPINDCVDLKDQLAGEAEKPAVGQSCALNVASHQFAISTPVKCSCGGETLTNTVNLYAAGTTTDPLATSTATAALPKCTDCDKIEITVSGQGTYKSKYNW